VPDDDDIALSEKRMYGEKRDRTELFVGSALGVTRVELAGDQIGRFALARRDSVTAIAGEAGTLVVGTDDDVLVGTSEEFVPTGFGTAATVSVSADGPVAATPDGTVARLEGDDWETVGSVTNPRRADGDLLVAGDGVYRVGEGLTALGGGDVRDVAAAGPYAATGEGVVRYDGEWKRVAEGECTLVAADGDCVTAASDEGLLVHRGGGWQRRERPTDAPLADLAHGECLYAVTADGTVLVDADPELTPDGQGGWRSRELGVREVVGLATA
jgi:hypothetical protein